MILYLAGGRYYLAHLPIPENVGWQYLASYYRDRTAFKNLNTIYEKSGRSIMLDSGGYSARRHMMTIKVEDLAAWIKDQPAGRYFPIANLDYGPLERQWQNQAYLDARFPDQVLPVFHPEEYFDAKGRDWFEGMMREREYVAIGGIVGSVRSKKELEEAGYFRWAFHHGMKHGCRIHGFGVTNIGALFRYPFYSGDSTTWLSTLRHGKRVEFDPMKRTLQPSVQVKYMKGKGDIRSLKDAEFLKMSLEQRGVSGIEEIIKLQTYATDLWQRRGITWTKPKSAP